MTRKEAAEKLKSLWYFLINNDYPKKDLDALKVAIKTLEQEPKAEVLDKIRERVELEKLGYPPSAGYYRAIMKVLQIIDKYKAESEGKE